jgi:hypothetical protein
MKRAGCIKQKPGAGSRPGANRQFQFPEYIKDGAAVNRLINRAEDPRPRFSSSFEIRLNIFCRCLPWRTAAPSIASASLMFQPMRFSDL